MCGNKEWCMTPTHTHLQKSCSVSLHSSCLCRETERFCRHLSLQPRSTLLKMLGVCTMTHALGSFLFSHRDFPLLRAVSYPAECVPEFSIYWVGSGCPKLWWVILRNVRLSECYDCYCCHCSSWILMSPYLGNQLHLSLSLSLSPLPPLPLSILTRSLQRTFQLFLGRPALPTTRKTIKEHWHSTRRLYAPTQTVQVSRSSLLKMLETSCKLLAIPKSSRVYGSCNINLAHF